ncbi:DUF535 family protein [Mesorhizobium sp. NPDC059025]|uniref:DUF535 family protein n=1 Tax=unclassified Mesorhizobium TaxID=325217 RepID=UPI0036926301
MTAPDDPPCAALPRRKHSLPRQQLNRWIRAGKRALVRRIFWREISAINDALSAEPFCRVLQAYPEIPFKPVRPYLVSGLNPAQRAAAVVGHYAAAFRLLKTEAFIESHIAGKQLLSLQTAVGGITVDLTGQQGLYREGEWRLLASWDGRAVMEVALAIVDSRLLGLGEMGPILWIGAIKTAAAGAHGLEDARTLTKSLAGLRPKSLLLLVAQSLAGGLKLSGVFAASNRGHVFATDPGLRRRVLADYDGFWMESGGRRVAPTIFQLPPTKIRRPQNEYKPNKRAQIRRRHQLEIEIERSVHEALLPLLHQR